MAEGEDREQRSGESGDAGPSSGAAEYDPTEKPGGDDEQHSDESGDTGDSDGGAVYDPAEQPGDAEEAEDSGPAFHPHDRARTEREWASDDEGREEKEEEDDELPDDEPPPGADSEKSREQERRQKDTPDEEETREPQKTEPRAEDEDEEAEKGPPPPFRAFMLFVGTIAFLVVGFLFFSALIAPTYIVALILAAAWFVGAYLLLGRFTRNRRHLRFPIRLAFAGTVLAILLWLVISTVSGTTVNERLVTGQRLSDIQPTARIPEKPQNQPGQTVLVATGKVVSSGAGSASGQASFVTLPNGQTKLTLKDLDVTSGPTLHVFLATHDGKSVSDSKDLGSLKGNKGSQQYDVPQNVDPKRYKSVVIWCKILGVPFGRAETKAQ